MNAIEIQYNRLYSELADLWPVISPAQDYQSEAESWIRVIEDLLGPGTHKVLDLGSGGGSQLSYIKSFHHITAVDSSAQMLSVSRELNPEIDHVLGDMRTIRTDRIFDAVIINDSIGYMLTVNDLCAAFETAAAHLRPGGICVVSQAQIRELFQPNHVSSKTHRRGDTEVTFIVHDLSVDPINSIVESLMFIVIRKGDYIRIELDRHRTGLFPRSTWITLLTKAGLQVDQYHAPCTTEGDVPSFLVAGKPLDHSQICNKKTSIGTSRP